MGVCGDRAARVLAYGLDLGAITKAASAEWRQRLMANGFWWRIAKMPPWQRVEVLLGLYERMVWKVDVPSDMDGLDRALWFVEREMNVFHRNMLGGDACD